MHKARPIERGGRTYHLRNHRGISLLSQYTYSPFSNRHVIVCAQPKIMQTLEVHFECVIDLMTLAVKLVLVITVKLVFCHDCRASLVVNHHLFLERMIWQVRNGNFLCLGHKYVVHLNEVISFCRDPGFGLSCVCTERAGANVLQHTIYQSRTRMMNDAHEGHRQWRQAWLFYFFCEQHN